MQDKQDEMIIPKTVAGAADALEARLRSHLRKAIEDSEDKTKADIRKAIGESEERMRKLVQQTANQETVKIIGVLETSIIPKIEALSDNQEKFLRQLQTKADREEVREQNAAIKNLLRKQTDDLDTMRRELIELIKD